MEILLRERPELAKIPDDKGNSSLNYAVGANNLEIVRLHLRFDPTLAYIKNIGVKSAFIAAAEYGHVRVAEELIRHCPDSGLVVDANGWNALHWAISNEQVDFVEYILKTPALRGLLNQPNNATETPLYLAVRLCSPEILRVMLANERVDRVAKSGAWSSKGVFFFPVEEAAKALKWVTPWFCFLNYQPRERMERLA